MNPFVPEFEGELKIMRVPDDFVERMRKRVEDGLFQPGNRRRANYSVRSTGRDDIAFGADDFLTAYNVGLNDVIVRRRGSRAVLYHAKYWRWTWSAVAHGAILGLVLIVSGLAVPDMRRHIDSYPFGLPAFLSISVFFSLLWPWILTAMHRKHAEKALRGILSEVISWPPRTRRGVPPTTAS